MIRSIIQTGAMFQVTPRGNRFRVRGTNHEGDKLEFYGFRSKDEAALFASRCQELVNYRRVGNEPDQYLIDWVNSLPEKLRARIIQAELINLRRFNKSSTMWKHIDDWEAWLTQQSRQKNGKYGVECANRVRNLLKHILVFEKRVDTRNAFDVDVEDDLAEFYYDDLTSVMIQNGMSILKVRLKGQKPRQPSVQTQQYYKREIKSFCKWMVDHERASSMPPGMQFLKIQRSIDPDDKVAAGKPASEEDIRRMHAAPEPRRSIYIFALNTGLRKDEIKSMTPKNFDLVAGTFWVYGKNKKKITLPLNRAAAEVVKKRIESGETPLFDMPSRIHEWLRKDTKNIDIKFRDLRPTFCTQMAKNNVHPKIAQKLMRHSTIVLTMEYYTGFMEGDHVKAVEIVDASYEGVLGRCATEGANKPLIRNQLSSQHKK